MNRKNKNDPGFTFIELIIAVTIFAIIAVSIYSTFSAGIRMWLKTSPMIEANQRYRVFFNTASLDLKNIVAYYPKLTSATSSFAPSSFSSFGAEEPLNFEGEPDRISFMTIMNVSDQDGGIHGEIARVAYVYDKANKAVKRLVATKAEGFDEAKAKAVEMLSNIEAKDFGFEYCYKSSTSSVSEYEYEWKEAWEGEKNKQKIPRGVRVKAGELKKTIFMPTGVLGEEI